MSRIATTQLGSRDPEPGDPGEDRSLPPPETFRVVTDETRQAIVETLWQAEDTPLAFTTLRRRAGIDRSGRFNYHLQELLCHCVRDTGEGYELAPAGERFVAALAAVPSLDRSP